MNVTFEAVKEQLDILGHAVPNDVVRAFLADINKRPDGVDTPASFGDASALRAHVPVLGEHGQHPRSGPPGVDSPALPDTVRPAAALQTCSTRLFEFATELDVRRCGFDRLGGRKLAVPCWQRHFQLQQPVLAHAPARTVVQGKKRIDHMAPADFTRCHRFTATASSTNTASRPSPPLRQPTAAARPAAARPRGHPSTTPFSTTRASSSARRAAGQQPASRGADAPNALDSVTARAEALLAAHDAHRASILREEFVGVTMSESRDTAQPAPRAARKAVPVSSEWGLRGAADDDRDDEASDQLPAAMAPAPRRRCASRPADVFATPRSGASSRAPTFSCLVHRDNNPHMCEWRHHAATLCCIHR